MKKNNNKNLVHIGYPEGLKSESVAMIYRVFEIDSHYVIRKLSEISGQKAKQIRKEYINYYSKKELHEEMHKLKSEILIAQMNNTDYKEKEKRLGVVLNKLGYKQRDKEPKGKGYDRYRVIPNAGRIKVYHGGR